MTTAECDLQDFPFFKFFAQRFLHSDLVAEESLEAVGAAVILWSASWYQVPAGSLPDHDKRLARIVGIGVDAFLKIKTAALRGFVLCSDGRWYHPVQAQQANEAYQSKLEQRWRTELARIKKHNQRHGTNHQFPTFEQFVAGGCVKARLPVLDMSPGTSPETTEGNGLQRERERERESLEEESPSQEGAEVIQLGGARG